MKNVRFCFTYCPIPNALGVRIKIIYLIINILINGHTHWHTCIKSTIAMNTEHNLSQMWDGCLRNERKQQEALYRALAPKMLAVCMRYANESPQAQYDLPRAT